MYLSGRRRIAVRLAVTAIAACVAITGCSSSGKAGTGGAGGCGGAGKSLLDSAKKDGSVVLYSALSDPVLQKIQQTFQSDCGIKLQYQRLTSVDQTARIDQEVTSGHVMFDVSNLSTNEWVQQHPAYWAGIDAKTLPSLSKVPAQYLGNNYVVTSLNPVALIYNTDSVKKDQLPVTPKDLLKPEWKGKFAIVPPGVGGGSDATYYLLFKKYGEAGFADFMRKLFAQHPRVVKSAANGAQQVAAGELEFVALAAPIFASDLKQRGAPIDTTFLQTSAAVPASVQIAKDGRHHDAAMLFLNWFVSPVALELVNGGGNFVTPYGPTGTSLKLPSTVTPVVGADLLSSARAKQTILSVYQDVTR